jgi:hypothetical protein
VEAVAELLGAIEGGGLGDPLPLLAYIAGQQVELPRAELDGARRRALLIRAAGGDPRREPDLDDRSAKSLALDLHTEARCRELAEALDGLAPLARDLPRVRAAVVFLAADLDLAWRLFMLARRAVVRGACAGRARPPPGAPRKAPCDPARHAATGTGAGGRGTRAPRRVRRIESR